MTSKKAQREQLIEEDLLETKKDSLPSYDLNPFPKDHSFTVADVRRYVYCQRYGGEVSADFARHVVHCEVCLPLADLIEKTDPLLTEKDEDEQLTQLLRAAQDPEAAALLEAKVQDRLAAAAQTTGAALGSAVSIFQALANKKKADAA